MIRKCINIAAVSGAYIATLIGAGFASGQEILRFFIRYGNMGIPGMVLVSVVFGIVAYTVIQSVSERGGCDFKAYLESIVPLRLAGVVELIIGIFMMAVFCVMAAGCGASIGQFFGVSEWVGVSILCVFCFICFLFDIRAILAVNGVLAPLIVFGIAFMCIYILKFREISVFSGNSMFLTDNWLISGVSYASYNVLTAVAVLVSMGKRVEDRSEAKWIGIVSGGSFFVLLMLLWVVLSIYHGKIELGEVPMLTLAIRQGGVFGGLYTAVLIMAMLTTAISNGFGVVNQLAEHNNIGRKMACAIVCSVGFLGAGMGFETLIDKGYNACGYIGAVLMIAILRDYFKKCDKMKKMKKNEDNKSKSVYKWI